jgi:hypothetical protein
MSFPTSPTNGQTTSINNIIYVYNSSERTWTRTQAANVYNSTLTFSSNGQANFGSNVVITGSLTATGTVNTGRAIIMGMVFGG